MGRPGSAVRVARAPAATMAEACSGTSRKHGLRAALLCAAPTAATCGRSRPASGKCATSRFRPTRRNSISRRASRRRSSSSSIACLSTGGTRTRVTSASGGHAAVVAGRKWLADVYSFTNRPPDLYPPGEQRRRDRNPAHDVAERRVVQGTVDRAGAREFPASDGVNVPGAHLSSARTWARSQTAPP